MSLLCIMSLLPVTLSISTKLWKMVFKLFLNVKMFYYSTVYYKIHILLQGVVMTVVPKVFHLYTLSVPSKSLTYPLTGFSPIVLLTPLITVTQNNNYSFANLHRHSPNLSLSSHHIPLYPLHSSLQLLLLCHFKPLIHFLSSLTINNCTVTLKSHTPQQVTEDMPGLKTSYNKLCGKTWAPKWLKQSKRWQPQK